MNKLLKKVASLAIVFAMLTAYVPFGAFAATCTTHTPNTDGSNVIYYVTGTEHYNVCTSCYEKYDETTHINGGNDVCTDCGVTLDSGTATHTHSLTAGTYGHMDPFGHMVVCGDSNCPGAFETHTNCVVGDKNGDGTWDCDYCGWDGVIYGMGGGGCSHSYDNKLFGVTEEGHYPICDNCEANGMETTHIDDENGGDGYCDICKASVALDNGKYIHAHISNGTSFATDVNDHGTVCSDCGSGYWESHSQKVDSNGNNVYEIGPAGHGSICAVCNQPYNGDVHADNTGDGNCDVCGFAITCNHDTADRWWDTDETEHTLHCTCGYPVQPAAAHTDSDSNGKCDECNVGVDSTCKHTHNWDLTQWFANNDNTEHFRKCSDSECTRSTNPHTVADTDSNNECDTCGLPMGSQGTSCTHSFIWFEVDHENHKMRCGNCTYEGSYENHSDTDNDNLCNGCGTAVRVNANNQIVHDHAFNINWDIANHGHFHECTDNVCTSAIDFASHEDNFNNSAPTHTTPDDLCDVCGYALGQSGGGSSCTHQNGYYTRVDKTGHQKVCNECGADVGSLDAHTDTDGDNMCDGCPAFLTTENGVFVHNHTSIPNNWFGGTTEHFYQCDSCGGTPFNAQPHVDSDSNNICDVCYAKLDADGEHHCDPADLVWIGEDEDQHKRICSNCRRIYEQTRHEDTDNNDKCDKCNVTLDADDKHIHQPDGNWTEDGPNEHCCECTECEGWAYAPHDDTDNDGYCDDCNRDLKCYHTRFQWYSTGEETHELHCGDCGQSIAAEGNHDDADGDGKCDVCKVVVVNNIHTHTWSTQWSNTGTTSHFHDCTDSACTTSTDSFAHEDEDGDNICDICGNTDYNDWCHNHSHNGEYHIMGDKHYTMCGNCNNAYGDGADHTHKEYVVSGDGHCSVCDVCETEYNNQSHSGVDGYHIDEDKHYPICEYCGELYSDGEEHGGVNGYDSDNDTHAAKCEKCDAPYGQREDHKDTDMNSECDICTGTVHHEMSDEYIEYNGGHAKYCYMCDGIYADTYQPHSENTDWFCFSETQHSHRCNECDAFAGTPAAHADSDNDGVCDDCVATVDSNGKHSHIYNNWMNEGGRYHIHFCEDCGLAIDKGEHTDTDGNKKCDVCSFTLNDDGFHECTEKGPEYRDNTGHWTYCPDCYSEFSAEAHSDANKNSVCDVCNGTFDTFTTQLTSANKADLLTRFKAALNKALNSSDPYAELKEFFDETQANDFVAMYNGFVNDGFNPQIGMSVCTEIVTAEMAKDDVDLQYMYNAAKKAVKDNTLTKLFAMDILAEIYADGISGMSCGELNGKETFTFTAKLNAGEVKSNRIWHIYVSEDDGETYKKIATSKKGVSEVTFTTDSYYNIFAVAYEEVATSSGNNSATTPTPAPTATPTPAPTVAPATKPAATPAPTDTPEATPEATAAPEMPKEADTTITEIVVTEEVIEAVKETVTVSEGTATVEKEALEAVVEATDTKETVIVLPLAQATEEVVNKAEVATEALAAVADADKDVVIELTDVTVKLDAEAVKAITEQANGKTIEIRAVKAEKHHLTDKQHKGLEDKDVAVVVTAQIFSDGEYLGDFRGGKATIKLPFQPEEGRHGKDHTVYFVDDHGDTTKVPSEYIDGHMVFTTSHFSDYAIVYEGEAVGDEIETVVPEVPTAENSFPIIPIAIIIVVIIIGCIIIFMKKKNVEE